MVRYHMWKLTLRNMALRHDGGVDDVDSFGTNEQIPKIGVVFEGSSYKVSEAVEPRSAQWILFIRRTWTPAEIILTSDWNAKLCHSEVRTLDIPVWSISLWDEGPVVPHITYRARLDGEGNCINTDDFRWLVVSLQSRSDLHSYEVRSCHWYIESNNSVKSTTRNGIVITDTFTNKPKSVNLRL